MARIDSFFKFMKEQNASDLHLATGNPPMLRIHGELVRIVLLEPVAGLEEAEWLQAIAGEIPAAASNFDHAGPLTETVLVGNLAVRTGKRVEWDHAKMKVTNDNKDAQKYVKREYRKGWTL